MDRTVSGASALRRLLAPSLTFTAVLLAVAGGAQAESGSRICGVVSKSRSHPAENVGFIMKVNKGDNRTCNSAINRALGEFAAVGGTGNKEGLNRIWRRVRGGSSGPFHGKNVFPQSFALETCENFTWYVSGRRGDRCVGMSRNHLYAIAAADGEFSRR